MKKDMTSGVIWKQIFVFALPVMAGNILQQLYMTVDGIIVGRYVGEAALSSVGVSQPLTLFWMGIAIGISVGIGVVISQYFGAGRHDEIPLAVDTAFILLGSLGLICTAVSLLSSGFCLRSILGVPENLLDESLLYYRIYCLSLFFCFIYNAASYALRGVGDSNSTMYFLLTTAVMNVGLDILFVAVFNWGVAGAAWATFIAQVVCCTVSFFYLRRRIKASQNVHFDKKICGLMLKLGIPAAIQQCIVSVGNMAMQRLVNTFGQASIAGFTVGNRLDSFMFVPIFGFQTALSNFTGQNIGAGKLDRVKRGMHATLIMAVITAIAICVSLKLAAADVVTLFNLTGEGFNRGVEQIRFVTNFFIIFAVYMSIGGVLQGSGDVAFQSMATLSALATRVILGYIGVALGIFGYTCAWCTLPFAWSLALTLTVVRYLSGKWKQKAVVKKEASSEALTTD